MEVRWAVATAVDAAVGLEAEMAEAAERVMGAKKVEETCGGPTGGRGGGGMLVVGDDGDGGGCTK